MASLKLKRVIARGFDGIFILTLAAVAWSFVHQQRSGVAVGARMTPLELTTLSGETQKLAPKGRPLLVAAFASWCGACRRSNTHLEALYEMGKDSPIDVAVVSVDESEQAAQSAVRSWPIHHPVFLDRDGEFSRTFAIEALPTYTLIDENGEVLDVHVGPAGAGTIRKWLNPQQSR